MVVGLLLSVARDKQYVKEDSSLLFHWSLAAPLTVLCLNQIYVRLHSQFCVYKLKELAQAKIIKKIGDFILAY